MHIFSSSRFLEITWLETSPNLKIVVSLTAKLQFVYKIILRALFIYENETVALCMLYRTMKSKYQINPLEW